jgi:carbamoylphosphate synthase large subunit
MKRNLLFVTSQEEDCEAGLSYALDLAKMMDKGIAILLVRKSSLMGRFEAYMSAAAFAEENEHTTAREILESARKEDAQNLPQLLQQRCSASGMAVRVYSTIKDTVTALREHLKQDSNVEMVLLSPSITEEGGFSPAELKKLIRSASRPIVTMARQPHLA